MDQRILEIFSEHKEFSSLKSGVEEGLILEIQEQLNVTFPDSYKDFLRTYGAGGIHSIYIFGIEKDEVETSSLYDYNQQFKSRGLPEGLVVIVDSDEITFCLDTNKLINNECPVVIWFPYTPNYPVNSLDLQFDEFLLEQLHEIIINL